MNTVATRKPKPKCLTLPSNHQGYPLKRKCSENSPLGLGVINELTPSSPRSSRVLFASPQPIPKAKIHKKIHVLDEMGFGSLITGNCEPGIESENPLKRRFSIGISDFWTGSSKQKFIRENGYKEAFDTMKKEVLINDLQKTTSLKKPTLPHIMDSHAKRRNLIHSESANPAVQSPKNLPVLSPKSTEKFSNAINNIVDKCNVLAKDSLKFKKQTEKIQMETKISPKVKRKMTKQEKDLISSIVYSMN